MYQAYNLTPREAWRINGILSAETIEELINKSEQHEIIEELIWCLEGMRDAMRKAMPHLPPDDGAVHCGEWLDEANETLEKAKELEL